MTKEISVTWPVALIFCAVLIAGFIGTSAFIISENAKVQSDKLDLTPVTTALADVKASVDALKTTAAEDTTRLDDAVSEILSEQDAKDKALEIASKYIVDEDFIEALTDELNDGWYTVAVDEDDVTVEILDSDVSGSDETYEVTFKIKVLEDGDKIAKINNVVLTVIDVDKEDSYEDAEVDEDEDFFDEVGSEDIKIYL
jgi:uncharacterized protein YoxC